MSSITLTERNKLHKTTRYDHGLGIIRVNSSTKRIEDFTKTLNLKSRSKTLLKRQSPIAYNKWYIQPELRYKNKSQNPKNDKTTLNDDHYVYKNLRNHEFWNWIHPFENQMLQIKNPQYGEKVDPQMLEGFKKYIDESGNKRLPSIVNHILEKSKTKR